MKVYAAFVVYDYEGGKLIGGFDTHEKAQLALDSLKDKWGRREIHELELNITTEIYI